MHTHAGTHTHKTLAMKQKLNEPAYKNAEVLGKEMKEQRSIQLCIYISFSECQYQASTILYSPIGLCGVSAAARGIFVVSCGYLLQHTDHLVVVCWLSCSVVCFSPRIEPGSPSLQSIFLTTWPLEKSLGFWRLRESTHK